MSNIKITQLPVATSLTGAEVVPLVQSGGTVQVAVSVFVDYLQDPGYFRAFPGTVSEVSYSFKDTLDTGIYSPATGQLGLVTVGAERLRIDSSGNVGIGTSAPLTGLQVSRGASEPLTEIGTLLVTGSTTAFRLAMGYSSGSNAGWIQSVQNGVNVTSILLNPLGGNVGIGTSAPGARLDVVSASGVQIAASNGIVSQRVGYCISSIGAYAGSASNHPYILLTNDTERLRIDASGNVGIGTSAPAGKLDVRGSNSATFALFSGASKGLRLNIDGSQTAIEGVDSTGVGSYQPLSIGGSILTLATAAVERLRIDASGNVRVGTAALATTATDGFLYVPTCPGTPTGVPTAITGLAPIVINSTNNKLYFYSGGAWRDAGP